jgi:hypothetical protein
MAALSLITADATFDRWDDEVLILDLDAGTPVLLVRPATTAAKEEVAAAPEELELAAPEVVTETTEPAEAASEPVEDPDSSTDDDIAALLEDLDAVEPSQDSAPSLKEALARSAAQLESEGIVAPESVGPAPDEDATPADVSDEEAAPEVEEAPVAWPWDTGDEKKFDLDSIEESRDESGSLVRASGDDEAMSFAKPVILGAEYSATPEQEDPPVEPPAPAAEVAEPTEPEAPVAVDPGADSSDFIDLGAAEPAAPAPMVPEDIAALTCSDCVYDSSCPNRGQLLPASCGSFQWK